VIIGRDIPKFLKMDLRFSDEMVWFGKSPTGAQQRATVDTVASMLKRGSASLTPCDSSCDSII